MDIYFLTGNQGKFNEVSSLIPQIKMLNIPDLPEIQSLDIEEIIKAKLFFATEKTQNIEGFLIVEDTGLYLNALNNFPGPLIKFMLSSVGVDGIYKICKSFNAFDAFATTTFGVLNTLSREYSFFSASVKGKISSPLGNHGFGWDSIFIPEGSTKTFAEMKTIEEKNNYSMRYKALSKLISYLERYE